MLKACLFLHILKKKLACLYLAYSTWNDCPGWPRHRENREFGSYFFQTGKTQGILFWHREKFANTGKIFALWLLTQKVCLFLGGLSLHLNHLIASRTANYDWPFGTLPFGLFCSNLDTRDLKTYPRAYSGHFWNMSLFDDSRAVWVLFRKWVVSENCILLRNGWPIPGYSDLVLGGEVPRLSHGPICFPIQNT